MLFCILVFVYKSFKELFRFGGFVLLSNLFNTFSNEIQGLLVGRMFSPTTMGLYTQAYRLEGTASHAISTILDQVTYPVLSSIQDDKKRLLSTLRRFTQIPAFFVAPLMAIMIVIAKPLIVFLFSEKWVACVPFFQILCVAGLAVSLQGIANNAIAAIGYSDVSFKWTVVKRTLTIILCVAGICLYGMSGLLWACVLGSWSVFLIHAYLVSKYIGYNIYRQVLDICPYILLSLLCGLFVYYTGRSIKACDIFLVSYQIIIFYALYLFLIVVFRNETGLYIVNFLKSKLAGLC